METKSRYEVIADLMKQKMDLILERDSFDNKILTKKRSIRDLKREIEDKEESLKEFESQVKERKHTISELILSVEDGLQRFDISQSQKK